ncbi:NAD(P)/FAD-dependent oxidoreductase [Snodgrassella communis]|uniref:NAD(P)/FAD-dependent oxidoreductase n=1 Tax=Snodgrassella communis TaxID=2946699 RepID=UPI001EF53387|nr:FAD-binding oxidoreductase [Snodgrassella communis]
MATSFTHTEPILSYYAASRNDHTYYPSLQGTVEVETCIIGGGLSGIGTALPLAQQQHSVALIEAAQIGYGASGRNGGQVIYGYAAEMSSIASMIGLKNAQTLWQWSRQAVALVEQQIQTYRIDCDWHRGYAHVAIRPRHLHALTEWVKEAAAHYHFHDYQIWNQHQLQQQLASERYAGAIFDQQAGHLHPLNYTLGLARAAAAAGALLFEHSPMLAIEPWQHGYRITTPNGCIMTKNLVIAVNAFTRSLQQATIQSLAAKILPVATYMIATEPLGERAQQLIHNNMAVCDTRFVLDYYRLSADKRLLFGGKVNYSGREPSQQQLIQGMRHDMLKVFPQLADVHIDYAWGGQVDISMNRIPHFGRLNPQLYFLQGFSGHGVAATGLGGQIVAEAISGDNSRLRLFEKITHHNFPGGKLLRLPTQWLGAGYYRLKDLLP